MCQECSLCESENNKRERRVKELGREAFTKGNTQALTELIKNLRQGLEEYLLKAVEEDIASSIDQEILNDLRNPKTFDITWSTKK